MQKKYKDINVNYVFYDNNSNKSLIFLHGWGQNIEMMMPIAKPFAKDYNVLIIDLPGFGHSDEPKYHWSLYDYSDLVDSFVKELKLKNIILIGHSFGGKVSICYALKHKVSKLVLLASPYTKRDVKPTLKMKFFKFIKNTPGLKVFANILRNHVGSTDYKNASLTMKGVLVKHVNLDLKEEVKKITCPVLLIWGDKDEAVPLEDAKYLEKNMKDCGLVVYPGCTHYAYLERLNQTISVLKSFIGSD